MLGELFETSETIVLEAGEVLFHAGDQVELLFQVTRGAVVLERFLADGKAVCQQRAGPGDVLAEASLYNEAYHCGARCVEAGQVQAARVQVVHKILAASADHARTWSAHLAGQVQHARLLAEIRSLRSVAERLDSWLAAHSELPHNGQWQMVAFEIAVSREALYRELAKRRI